MLNSILLQANAQAGGGLSSILMIVLLVVIFWFFMIRPQSKKQKENRMEKNSEDNIKQTNICITEISEWEEGEMSKKLL